MVLLFLNSASLFLPENTRTKSLFYNLMFLVNYRLCKLYLFGKTFIRLFYLGLHFLE